METPNIENLQIVDEDIGLEINFDTPIKAKADFSICLVGSFLTDKNI